MGNVVWVEIGGFIGSALRYGAGGGIARIGAAAASVALQLVLGLGAVWAGDALVRAVTGSA